MLNFLNKMFHIYYYTRPNKEEQTLISRIINPFSRNVEDCFANIQP
jgi:hypothetical protein